MSECIGGSVTTSSVYYFPPVFSFFTLRMVPVVTLALTVFGACSYSGTNGVVSHAFASSVTPRVKSSSAWHHAEPAVPPGFNVMVY